MEARADGIDDRRTAEQAAHPQRATAVDQQLPDRVFRERAFSVDSRIASVSPVAGSKRRMPSPYTENHRRRSGVCAIARMSVLDSIAPSSGHARNKARPSSRRRYRPSGRPTHNLPLRSNASVRTGPSHKRSAPRPHRSDTAPPHSRTTPRCRDRAPAPAAAKAAPGADRSAAAPRCGRSSDRSAASRPRCRRTACRPPAAPRPLACAARSPLRCRCPRRSGARVRCAGRGVRRIHRKCRPTMRRGLPPRAR
jgi:hypothetical protein